MVDPFVSFKVSVSSSLTGVANEMLTFYMQLSKSIGLKQSASLITLFSASMEPVDVRSTANICLSGMNKPFTCTNNLPAGILDLQVAQCAFLQTSNLFNS